MAISAPKLKYNGDEVTGWVTSTPSFDNENGLVRLDLLSDWIGGLEELYNNAHQDYFNNYSIPPENVDIIIDALTNEFIATLNNDPVKMLQWIQLRVRGDFEDMKPNELVRLAEGLDVNLDKYKINKV